MTDDTIPQTVFFPDLCDKPLVATFDQQHASSDGGAVVLSAAERQYGVLDNFTACLVDDRQPGEVRHTVRELLTQRIFGMACGHADANDAERLADDPIHKLLLGRDPVSGAALASQPTISRFENQGGVQELYAMGRELATSVIARHQRRLHGRAHRIIIDLDPTDDPTHGAQQLTFFNGHYDSWCYLPLLAFIRTEPVDVGAAPSSLYRAGNALHVRPRSGGNREKIGKSGQIRTAPTDVGRGESVRAAKESNDRNDQDVANRKRIRIHQRRRRPGVLLPSKRHLWGGD